MKTGRKNNNSGFSLVELIIVIAIMAVLVVYCLKSVPDAWYPGGVCQLLGVGATALAHKWKHNTFLSILAGTAVYMVLLRVL